MTFDFSAVTSVVAAGLETVMSLMDTVRLLWRESNHSLRAASGAAKPGGG